MKDSFDLGGSAELNGSSPGVHDALINRIYQTTQDKDLMSFKDAPPSLVGRLEKVTVDGVKNLPDGFYAAVTHDLKNPLEVATTIGSSAAMAIALRSVFPEGGMAGRIAGFAIGAYFTYVSTAPIVDAYKKAASANTLAQLDDASKELGSIAGKLMLNGAVAGISYKASEMLTDRVLRSTPLTGFINGRNNFYDKIADHGLKVANKLGFENASKWNIRPEGTITPGARAKPDAIESTLLPRAGADAAPRVLPQLPELFQPIQEIFFGKQITGISREFIKNLSKDESGLPFPDLLKNPEMLKYAQEQNKLTFASVDRGLRSEISQAIDQKTRTYTPPGWNGSGSGRALDIVDSEGGRTMSVGSRTFSLSEDGAANRKLVEVDAADSTRVIGTVIPEPKDFEIQQVIKATANGADKFAVVGRHDGVSVLYIYDAAGAQEKQIPLPGYGILREAKAGNSSSELQFLYDTPSSVPLILKVDLASDTSLLSPLRNDAFDSNKFITEKLMVPFTDRDGKAQDVPVYISHNRQMQMDGANPTIMHVYGGFDAEPYWLQYYPHHAALMERGAVIVSPVLPGDGGRGIGNFKLGIGANMENTDLATIAIAKKIQEMHISSPETTALFGVSNGGMVVNSVLNQRPELFGAAVSESGVNSLFDSPVVNVKAGKEWQSEFGNPSNPKDVEWMSKLDVLTNLSRDKQYPPTLIGVGTSDGIVNAGNGITYANMRQGMNNGETLLYFRSGEGHQPEDLSVQTAFLLSRLKVR